jgi:hypothetical protein
MTLLLNLALAAILILTVVAGWALLSRIQTARPRRADGWARVEGTCGSRLDIGLSLVDGRVERSVCRAQGCGYDCACIQAAGRLARGKTPAELLRIDADAIRRAVGDLPEDHGHCAHTAARALHAASRDCLRAGGSPMPETLNGGCAAPGCSAGAPCDSPDPGGRCGAPVCRR